jgi:hypothetical protein
VIAGASVRDVPVNYVLEDAFAEKRVRRFVVSVFITTFALNREDSMLSQACDVFMFLNM